MRIWQFLKDQFHLLPEWSKPVFLAAILALPVWKTILKPMWKMLRDWWLGKFDEKTYAELPRHNAGDIRVMAQKRKVNSKRFLQSCRRLAAVGRAMPIHVDDEPDENFWTRL